MIRTLRKILPVFGVFVISCGSGNKTEADSPADSLVQNRQDAEVEIARLNDTVYASVSKVWYNVENTDTVSNRQLASLKDQYASSGSVLTFRNNAYRNGIMEGRLDTVPTDFEVEWTFNTDQDRSDTVFGPWGGGSGWTGQPLYVVWPDSAVQRLTKNKSVNNNFEGKEVIIGSLCGNVYFLNPETGRETRSPIAVGNTIKGTVSLDPSYNGLLYVGHGTPGRRPFGAVTVDLFKNEVIDIFKEDPKALRHWGAYDSSAIRVGQYVFRPAENGSVYKFLVTPHGLKLESTLRYKVDGAAPGIESSMSVYSNYGYVGDNHGNILAINLDTMKPVWFYSLGDDTDATPVINIENGKPYLYVGCEIDRQPRGYAVFAKLDATDGKEVWKIQPEGRRREDGKKHFDGGFYSSPLIGQGDAEGLIFTNLVKNTSGANGAFLALDTQTGNVVYELPLKYYSWSSPVGFLTKNGKQIIVTADCAGNLYLIDAKEGKIIKSRSIGNNFESSPVVTGNKLYIGSRGNGIHKVSLK